MSLDESNVCAGCDGLLRTRFEVEDGFCLECQKECEVIENMMEALLGIG
jgi:hypothetical protein